MKKKVRLNTWSVLWILLILNIILLLYALFDQGIWYIVSSLIWSLGILRYHSRATVENKEDIGQIFSKNSSMNENKFIKSKSDNN